MADLTFSIDIAPVTELTDPHIQEAVAVAREARRQLGVSLSRPFDRDLIDCVEAHFGLAVCILNMPDRVAGAYLRRGRRSYIFIQAHNFPTRQRFTIAHELGHHLLGHGAVLESYKDVGRDTADPAEQQANYFASELLHPIEAVCAEIERRNPEGRPLDMTDVVLLARDFHVSPLAMLYRLSKGDFPGVDRPLLDVLWSQALEQNQHLAISEELGIGHGSDEVSRCFDAGDFPRLPAGLDGARKEAVARLVRRRFKLAAEEDDADD